MKKFFIVILPIILLLIVGLGYLSNLLAYFRIKDKELHYVNFKTNVNISMPFIVSWSCTYPDPGAGTAKISQYNSDFSFFGLYTKVLKADMKLIDEE